VSWSTDIPVLPMCGPSDPWDRQKGRVRRRAIRSFSAERFQFPAVPPSQPRGGSYKRRYETGPRNLQTSPTVAAPISLQWSPCRPREFGRFSSLVRQNTPIGCNCLLRFCDFHVPRESKRPPTVQNNQGIRRKKPKVDVDGCKITSYSARKTGRGRGSFSDRWGPSRKNRRLSSGG